MSAPKQRGAFTAMTAMREKSKPAPFAAGHNQMSDPITLDFLARQQQRILDELSGMRSEMASMRTQFTLMQDDIRVLTAMAMRQDTATRNTLDLLHRTMERVSRLETAASEP